MSKPQHPKSDRGLARALGVSHVAIGDWRKRFAGQIPKGRDVADWQRFIESNGLAEAQRAGVLSDLRKAKLRELNLRCEALSRELKRTDREVLTVAEVDKLLGVIARRFKTAVLSGLESDLPPKLDGLPAAQVRVILREFADGLLDEMAGALADVPVKYGYGSEVKISD